MPSCLWISKCQAHDRKLAHSTFLVITVCIRTQNQMFSVWIFEPIIHSMDTSQNQTFRSYWQLCQCFWHNFHWNFSIYVLSCLLKARTVSRHKIYLRVSFSLSLLFFINTIIIIILGFYIPTHLFFWRSSWGFKYARQGLYYVFSTWTFNLFLAI